MRMLTDGDDHHIFGEQVHVFSPTRHAKMAFFRGSQSWIDLVGRHFFGFLVGKLNQTFVKHCGEDVDRISRLRWKAVVEEVGEIKVDNDIIEEGIMFKRGIVLVANGDSVTI